MRLPYRAHKARISALIALAFAAFTLPNCLLGQKRPPAKRLNLNTATAAQLQQLPGVGLSTAQAIVKFREKSGPFQRVEDLLAIYGISKTKLEKLRPYVTVRREHAG
jgi:competence ComEA-like helix-hairpin-helix protein